MNLTSKLCLWAILDSHYTLLANLGVSSCCSLWMPVLEIHSKIVFPGLLNLQFSVILYPIVTGSDITRFLGKLKPS